MSTPTTYIALAAIYALRNMNGALPTTRAEFAQVVEDRYKWKIEEEAIDKIIRQFDRWDIITIIQDKYAGEMLRLYRARQDEALHIVSQDGNALLVQNATMGGVPWFQKIFSNNEFWIDLHRDPLPEPNPTPDGAEEILDEVSISDRLVVRAEQRTSVELIESDIRSLIEEIETNNEVGAELGDERIIVSGELKSGDTLLSQPVFRLSKLHELVVPALKYLAEKFASGAVGEMAKRLITAILGLS